MDIQIFPGKAAGILKAPPSKSYGHRMLICASLSSGKSTVEGISKSEDMGATLDCIAALGENVKCEKYRCELEGLENRKKTDELPVYNCRESGSTLRFFIPIALALTGGGIFRGSERLIERGIGVYEDIFSGIGIKCEKGKDSIRIEGNLIPGEYSIPGNISSQFVSGLLFALPLLGDKSTVTVIPPVESRKYIDMTVDAMKNFGAEVKEPCENTFVIEAGQKYTCADAQVEGDWSNAAFILALARLSAEKDGVRITGLNEESIQGDRICKQFFDEIDKKSSAAIDISGCPDLGPILFAYAAAKGGARFTGIRRLRIKESDRAQVMSEVLSEFGIETEVSENELVVFNGKLTAPAKPVYGNNDHRIVMSTAVLMALCGGMISGAEAVNKSYPDFFDDLNSLGIECKKI